MSVLKIFDASSYQTHQVYELNFGQVSISEFDMRQIGGSGLEFDMQITFGVNIA